MKQLSRAVFVVVTAAALSGCLGAVVGTAADVTIEVAKVPFKVAGAAVDVASGGDGDKDKGKD